ncbi:hypothetical protein AKA01nite_11190 [Alkalibacterium kapii]|uniref:Uncharacterized protein n=1 Tax=Alkalibacterium kapii TaxID=426704 RepID=A0A511B109_9LACT|nr:hypothetical protein AKA01nite_11190 [Alkalibacterium kapii]
MRKKSKGIPMISVSYKAKSAFSGDKDSKIKAVMNKNIKRNNRKNLIN